MNIKRATVIGCSFFMKALDFYKKESRVSSMKSRSTVTKGMNLSTRVEKQRKGKGAYVRRNRYNKWE